MPGDLFQAIREGLEINGPIMVRESRPEFDPRTITNGVNYLVATRIPIIDTCEFHFGHKNKISQSECQWMPVIPIHISDLESYLRSCSVQPSTCLIPMAASGWSDLEEYLFIPKYPTAIPKSVSMTYRRSSSPHQHLFSRTFQLIESLHGIHRRETFFTSAKDMIFIEIRYALNINQYDFTTQTREHVPQIRHQHSLSCRTTYAIGKYGKFCAQVSAMPRLDYFPRLSDRADDLLARLQGSGERDDQGGWHRHDS